MISARRALLAAGALVMGCVTASGCLPGAGLLGGASAEPEVGQCYATPDRILPDAHDPTEAVDCAEPHTLETYAVLATDKPPRATDASSWGERCRRNVGDYLGGDPRDSAVTIYFFTPTPRQQDDGARWVRCDVGVVTDTALAGARSVTGSLQDAFAGGIPRSYRRCLAAPPDPTRRQRLVPCVQPHVAEQLPHGVELGGPGDPYPGRQTLTQRANRGCARTVGAALPEAARSMVVVPTRALWEAGRTAAQCWALARPGERLNDSETQTT